MSMSKKQWEEELLAWLKTPEAEEEFRKADEECKKIDAALEAMKYFDWRDLQMPYTI